MKLIDANALKEDLKRYFTDGVLDGVSARLAFNQILHDIDNAPTVEAIPTELHEKIMDKVEGELLECQSHLRPQDKWIITKDEKFYRYKCPFCGRCDTGDFLKTDGNLDLPNFCEKCGADMRGE